MPKKNAKGDWEFSADEEGEIEMAARARVRADEIISNKRNKENCEAGNHRFVNKKCKFCDAPEPAKEPETEPKGKKKSTLW